MHCLPFALKWDHQNPTFPPPPGRRLSNTERGIWCWNRAETAPGFVQQTAAPLGVLASAVHRPHATSACPRGPMAVLGRTCFSQMWPLQMFRSICKGSAGKHPVACPTAQQQPASEQHWKITVKLAITAKVIYRDVWGKDRWCSLTGGCPGWNARLVLPLLPPPFSARVWQVPSVQVQGKNKNSK